MSYSGKLKRSFKKILLLTFIAVIAALAFYLLSLPDVSKLKKENPGKTSFMQYREKEWRKEGRKYRINQIWAPLSNISPYLIKAVLIGEDDKFWRHEGFDYEAIQKALEKDLKKKRLAFGGSTISQQLAKNLYLLPSKNLFRKIKEALITWKIERSLSKSRILELYLNVVEWGDGGIFGIEAASRHYYGKPASELSPVEASRLAAVLPNPRRFSPLGDSRYVVSRSRLIYSIMVRRGIVEPGYEELTDRVKEDAIQPPYELPVSPLTIP
ncbi:MAG: monofunctional biosynthetic peptidoglycan transglycosylase [Nitrospirae bacterium]|nr:monofunctional biosynthetic peptidoglycan transglycosylase [Nitrospirota bacterium]